MTNACRPEGWITMEMTGLDRTGQYIDTVLLRLKVKLYLRRYRTMKRRFLTGWMSRG